MLILPAVTNTMFSKEGPAIAHSFEDSVSSSSGTTSSRSFSNVSIGSADPARKLILAIGYDSAGSSYNLPTNVEMVINSTTYDFSLVHSGNYLDRVAAIYISNDLIPSGTTGTLNVTVSTWSFAASVYRVLNVGSTFGTDDDGAASSSLSSSVSANNEGLIIASSYFTASNLSGRTISFTGVSGDEDRQAANISRRLGTGSLSVTADEVGRTVSISCAGSVSYQAAMVVASFNKL